MSEISIWNWVGLVLLLAINAFFVAAEYAMVRVRKTRLDELAQRGVSGANSAQIMVSRIERYIATTQVGITMAGIGLGWLGEPALSLAFSNLLSVPLQAVDETVRRTIAALVSLLLVTFITVVVGELVPKAVSLSYPEQVSLGVSRAVLITGQVFRPFIWALNHTANLVLRLIGLPRVGDTQSSYTIEELKLLVAQSEASGVLADSEREMLHAVFDFGELTAREAMVPRTEMLAVEADLPVHELIHRAIKYPHSMFPVYEGDLDHIVGIAHVKDLVRVQHDERRVATLRGLMREALFVPDTIRLDKLLQQFRVKKHHLAIVLDEYGGTAGLVTLEDVVEKIVGEVQDPFDRSTPEIQRLPDGSALVDGLTLIETVNDKLALNLRDEHYDTIAGYVLGRLGRMAQVGDTLEVGRARLRVEALDGLRIARLSLVFLKPEGDAPVADP